MWYDTLRPRLLPSLACFVLATRSRLATGFVNKNINRRATMRQSSTFVGQPCLFATWKAGYTLPDPLPVYKWNPFIETNPAQENFSASKLLITDTFVDKSEVVYQLLKDSYNYRLDDFRPVPLLVVHPRRFGKSTLLGFIEAVYSPLPTIGGYKAEQVKEKVAALQYGPQLLNFGLHPVLHLDMSDVLDVDGLNKHIATQLEKAGLEQDQILAIVTKHQNPGNRVQAGVKMLNEKFERDTNKETRTIVLINEYDKPFRDKERDSNDPLLRTLPYLYGLGKVDSGISLLVLCALTRIVGFDLSLLNNQKDVSELTKYHGLCGLSVRELVRCADGQLDELAKQQYDNQTFFDILTNVFAREWNGYRCGLTEEKGILDPDSAEGVVFSPLDAWKLTKCLTAGIKNPFSEWIATMGSEFEFIDFSEEDKVDLKAGKSARLFQNLNGESLDSHGLALNLNRQDYLHMALRYPLHVKKVLFELGVLSVKRFTDGRARLGSPNYLVTIKAMDVLVKKIIPGVTPLDLAKEYLSKAGFDSIVSSAAEQVTLTHYRTGLDGPRESLFQDWLCMELRYRFTIARTSYRLFKEVPVTNAPEKEGLGISVALLYEGTQRKVYVIEVKFARLSKGDDDSIEAAHQKNMKEATKADTKYLWDKQNVAVSGVWHLNEEDGTYAMSWRWAFVETRTSSPQINIP